MIRPFKLESETVNVGKSYFEYLAEAVRVGQMPRYKMEVAIEHIRIINSKPNIHEEGDHDGTEGSGTGDVLQSEVARSEK